MTDRELMQMALDALETHAKQYPHMVKGYTVDATEALRTALAQPEPEPVGNTLTFMTRAIFNVIAKHQEINGGYFIADGDIDDFIERLAKVINSTFEPLKPKNTTPPKKEWVGLTDEEIFGIFGTYWGDADYDHNQLLRDARRIELAVEEKNT